MNICDYSSSSTSTPKSQIVYNSILFQSLVSKYEKNPHIYLPSILGVVFHLALTRKIIRNPYRESVMSIIGGIDIRINSNDGYISVSSGSYIVDHQLIENTETEFHYFDKSTYHSNISHLLVSLSKNGIKLWWYDIEKNKPIGIKNPADHWTSELFILAAYRVEFNDKLIKLVFERELTKITFIINNKEFDINKIPYFYKDFCDGDILEIIYPFYKFLGIHAYAFRTDNTYFPI